MDGRNRKNHPARMESSVRNTRMMVTLFQHFPCGLGEKQKFCSRSLLVSFDDIVVEDSRSSCREDNSSSNDKQRRSV